MEKLSRAVSSFSQHKLRLLPSLIFFFPLTFIECEFVLEERIRKVLDVPIYWLEVSHTNSA